MLDTGQGIPCQPANFLRALRTIPEASALGLIFSEANSMSKTSVPRLIQSWNRFILQQIHLQCTEKIKKPSSVSDSYDKQLAGHLSSADWSRSSPAKKVSEVSDSELASIS